MPVLLMVTPDQDSERVHWCGLVDVVTNTSEEDLFRLDIYAQKGRVAWSYNVIRR